MKRHCFTHGATSTRESTSFIEEIQRQVHADEKLKRPRAPIFENIWEAAHRRLGIKRRGGTRASPPGCARRHPLSE